MQPTVEIFGNVAVVGVNVLELELSNVDDFRRDMSAILEEHRHVVLDMSRINFIDSSGCGVILSCLKRLSQAGGDLKLCCVNPPVLSVLELIRLNRICEIHDTKETAVESFKGGGP